MRVNGSGFEIDAAWEQEFWADMGTNWMPCFDNLRLDLAHFTGQEANVWRSPPRTRVGRLGCGGRCTTGILIALAYSEGEGKATVGLRAHLFSADAANWARREEPGWTA